MKTLRKLLGVFLISLPLVGVVAWAACLGGWLPTLARVALVALIMGVLAAGVTLIDSD